MELKIVSYNIMSGRTYTTPPVRNYDFCAEVINNISPDIIGLNEVGKHATAGFPAIDMKEEVTEYLGRKTGMYHYFAKAIEFGDHGYGNGILSKYPIKSAKTVIIPDPEEKREEYKGYYETRSVLVAEIDVCGGITVLVTHIGLVPEEKQNAINTILSLLETIKTPVLLMGDFNITPDDETMKPFFGALCDTAEGKSTPHTWPSDLQKYVGEYEAKIKNIKENDASRKIDYIFTSSHFKTESIEVYQSTASDHMPYITKLKLGGNT